MKGRLEVLTNIAVTLACVTFVVLAFFHVRALLRNDGRPPAHPPPVVKLDGRELRISNDVFLGSPSATVALIEFSDYQCPFCAVYARDTFEQIRTGFVDTGRVRYAFKSFPNETAHPLAFLASEAAECAGRQARYWDMHRQLFLNHDALQAADLSRYAEDLHLDVGRFQECLSGSMAPRVRQDMADGTGLGVSGTPTFVIGEFKVPGIVRLVQQINGAQPYSVFKATLEGILERASFVKQPIGKVSERSVRMDSRA